jgi:hypothetical protein
VIKHYALLDGTFSSHHHTMQTGPKLDGMVAEKWAELELGAVKSFPRHGALVNLAAAELQSPN